jgi:hypothetical protein
MPARSSPPTLPGDGDDASAPAFPALVDPTVDDELPGTVGGSMADRNANSPTNIHSNNDKSHVVFEVLGEIDTSGDDWLFVVGGTDDERRLRRRGGGGATGGGGDETVMHSHVTSAFQQALRGRPRSASDMLAKLPAHYVATAPLVQRLRRIVAHVLAIAPPPSSVSGSDKAEDAARYELRAAVAFRTASALCAGEVTNA